MFDRPVVSPVGFDSQSCYSTCHILNVSLYLITTVNKSVDKCRCRMAACSGQLAAGNLRLSVGYERLSAARFAPDPFVPSLECA